MNGLKIDLLKVRSQYGVANLTYDLQSISILGYWLLKSNCDLKILRNHLLILQ